MEIKINPALNIKTVLFIFAVQFFWLGIADTAQALPSFSRQTGMACATCHTQAFGPNLTPMGRQFKLGGYLSGGGDSILSRFGGGIQGSFTNMAKADSKFTDPNNSNFDPNYNNRAYNNNNNLALEQATFYYGGKVFGHLGALVQTTYDGVANRLAFDESDIRLSDEADAFNQNFIYGISFNNNPSTQDLWNTSPAWNYPYVSSPLANTPAAGPIISNLSGQVGGATAYTMINDLVFLEAGAYGSFAKYAQKGMGQWDTTNSTTANNGAVKLNGGAPYWRIALQKEWQGHYVSLGHFGFQASLQPDATIAVADRYTDLGMDFNYQYLANPLHIYEFKASYIREHQALAASYNPAFDPSNPQGASGFNQQLGFLGLNGSYTYNQTYSLTAGYNHIYGNADAGLYSSSPTNRPNSEYFTFELDYVPFGKTASSGSTSYMNIRFAAQYVAYTLFDGATSNYAGTGRNASDNNTLYFNGWLVF